MATSDAAPDDPHEIAARHDPIYDDLHASAEFTELRKRYRGFAFPATVAFLAWYFTYVVLTMWAHDFMSTRIGDTNFNIALVFGVLQFVTTFLLAWLYSRYSTSKLDPLARALDERFIALNSGKDER
ncbi:MAG: DUF485 domain-containing protein [Nocardioidaceae bacterium]|nr:DUF485 domain-containing protein [Nocardioidaceae bacterium]